MSWKSIVSASVLCLIASPAFAAPAISVAKGGTVASSYLNAQGNWVWNIQISNTSPVPTGSSPLAAELGFTASGSALVGASNLSTGAGNNFDTSNPGSVIFGWETLTDVDPGAGVNNKPVGLQTNVPTNQVFSALGSVDYSAVGPHDYIQIVTKGPVVGALSSTLTVSGAYNSGRGRIAELNPAGTPASLNFDTYNNVFTRTATAGDADLGNGVGLPDLAIVLNGQGTGQFWHQGNFDGVGTTGLPDLAIVLNNQGQPSANSPGAGSVVASSAVPEPSTVMLLVLCGGLLTAARRVR